MSEEGSCRFGRNKNVTYVGRFSLAGDSTNDMREEGGVEGQYYLISATATTVDVDDLRWVCDLRYHGDDFITTMDLQLEI